MGKLGLGFMAKIYKVTPYKLDLKITSSNPTQSRDWIPLRRGLENEAMKETEQQLMQRVEGRWRREPENKKASLEKYKPHKLSACFCLAWIIPKEELLFIGVN